jgi:hypothetical protein
LSITEEVRGVDCSRQIPDGNAVTNDCRFPSRHAIDYAALLSAARAESEMNLTLILKEQLVSQWCDRYVRTATHVANLVRFPFRTFEYIFDSYSELESMGEIPYNQTIQNRVVAVIGTSTRAGEIRDAGRLRNWAAPAEEFVGAERDRGHFMAHCIGGGFDVNVFSQERRLNRGWSPQGKIYRQMENYCYEQPGTFCFSRPIYEDGSSVPRWLEFGVLKTEGTLWVEVFDN